MSNFEKKINFKTPKIINFIYSFFLILLPYFLIWIFLGDLNLLKINWIIPVGKYLSENLYNDKLEINNYIYIVLFSMFIFSIIPFLVLKFFFKKVNFDLLPFIFMFNGLGWSLIISGFLPFYENIKYYIIIARFFIILFVSLFLFFVSNKFSLFLIIKYENINQLIVDYNNEEKQADYLRKDYKKIKNNNNDTYIDVIEDKNEN